MIQIQTTEDYTLFKRIKGNRVINKAHISRLANAIKENAEISKYTPIVVNEHFEIVDGQHRLEAWKALGLPVHYIQGKDLTLTEVQDLNSMNKAWTPMDFARSYAEIGNKHYKTYIEFKQTYHLNHDILLQYLGLENPITGTMFKDGKLKATDPARSHKLCVALQEVGEFYPKYNRRSFALAFKRMWMNPNYDHEHFLEKMEIHGDKLQDYALPEDYLRAMEKFYNLHLRSDESRVRFF